MFRGFFNFNEVRSNMNPDGKIHSCVSCGLYKDVLSPKMAAFGDGEMGVLNVGEAPGETEDRRGKQWQGSAGRLLRRTYKDLGVDLFKDCVNINAINCRPTTESGSNRTPSPHEVSSCRHIVLNVINQTKPKVIIVLGKQALISLLGHRWKKDLGGIAKWRGWIVPDRDLNAWLCPVWHPSFVRRLDSREAESIWRQDLKHALAMVDAPFPSFSNDRDCVEIIDTPDKLLDHRGLVEIDYETTGLKPHAPGHRIVCASVCSSDNHVQVFMMPKAKSGRSRFLDLLHDTKSGKMAHNMKFEDTWSKVRLRCAVRHWAWDSMLAAHVLDNRPGITGLKFQTYVNFGVVDYDSEIAPYLRAKDGKSGNSQNKVLELIRSPEGRRKLMTYCGLDSLYGYRLSKLQMKTMQIDPSEL